MGVDDEFIKIQQNEEYSPTILVYMHELMQKDMFEVELNLQYKVEEIFEPANVVFVLSVENGKEVLNPEFDS